MNAARMIALVVPAPVHRVVLNVVHRIRTTWWRARGHEPDDTRVVALDAVGRVLLVRHSYGDGAWMLPGGGSKRGEDALATATRELREEAGCALVAPRQIAGTFAPNTRKRAFVVAGRTSGTVRIDGREIVESRFVAPDALPPGSRPSLHQTLARWVAEYEVGETR